jgi:hypothetical protein
MVGDKKSKDKNYPGPVTKWMTRKETLEKKIK